MDLRDPSVEDRFPGWRALLRAVRDVAEGFFVYGAWTIVPVPRLVLLTAPSPRAPVELRTALIAAGAAMSRTCDQCGRLGRPVKVEDWWGARCGEHDPAAPSYFELWEALNQAVWLRDFEVGMVRFEEMTEAQRRAALEELRRDPVGIADQAQRRALFRAARKRDRNAFEDALRIPADDPDEARRMVEGSPLMRALSRGAVESAIAMSLYRYRDVLNRIATEDSTNPVEDEDE